MEGLPPSNWARRAGAYRGALFTLAEDGVLRRWDMEKAEPSFTVPCGDGIARLTTFPRSLVLTGPGGRVAVRDPDSGAERGPVRSIGLAAGEEVEDLIPETDFPDGGFIIRARRSGDEEILASDAQGRLRWRLCAGSPLPISMRPVSLPNGRKAVLLSAQAWGVRLMRCP